jgi:multidrug efflux pump subunit AcrB
MTIKKRAFLVLVPALLLTVGVYLGIRFMPAVWKPAPAQPLPTIIVDATYPGARASVIAETVAAPIEQQVNGVEEMVSMRSRCGSDGSYSLTVTFQRGANLDMAQVLVQNRVALALPFIPDAVQNNGINIRKKSVGFLLVVNVSSPDGSRDSVFLSNYATIQVRDELTRLPGVSDVVFVGRSDQRTYIGLDLNQLAAHEITVNDAIDAIRQQNVRFAGPIGQPPLPGKLHVEHAKQIILKVAPGGRILYLKDMARLEDKEVERNVARFNGKPVASLFIYALPQANSRELRSALEERLAQLRERLPDGISLDVALDFTTNLDRTPSYDHLWLDVNLPIGAARARTSEVLENAEKILRTVEPVRDVLQLSGPPFAPFSEQGCMLIRLESADRSDADRAEIIQTIRDRLAKEIPAATIRLRDLAGQLPPGDYPINLAIHGPDPDKARDFAAKLVDRLRMSSKLIDVCVKPESAPVPQPFVGIDRAKMAELGVPLQEVNRTLEFCFGSPRIDGIDDIVVRYTAGVRADENIGPRPADVKQLKVRSVAGKLLPLADMVKLSESKSARVVHRLDLLPVEEITANPAPGVSLAEARSLCASLAEVVRQELRLTAEYRLIWP